MIRTKNLKIFVFAAVLIIALILTACGDGPDPVDDPSQDLPANAEAGDDAESGDDESVTEEEEPTAEEEPETEEPATEEPTTEEPTTEEPTTQAPTTERPTQAPTPAPTQPPTPAPTQPPTPAPTQAPAPTQPPTPAPTQAPTQPPPPSELYEYWLDIRINKANYYIGETMNITISGVIPELAGYLHLAVHTAGSQHGNSLSSAQVNVGSAVNGSLVHNQTAPANNGNYEVRIYEAKGKEGANADSMLVSIPFVVTGELQPPASASAEELSVYQKIVAMRATYPQGTPWTDAIVYEWNGNENYGTGCAAFAYILSDAAFGNAAARSHTDTNNIKIGDILRLDNDTHSVIILEVDSNGVTIAEGNWDAAVNWGRRLTWDYVRTSTNYILTRYQ